MTYAAVGSIQSNTGSPVPSLSLTTTSGTHFVLAEVINTGTATATALASSNCTWTTLGTPYTGVTTSGTCQCFLGVVTTASTANVTITWGAGTTNVFSGLVAQEFSTTTGTPLLDKQGHLDSAGTSTWPSLSPAAAGEAYFGYALNAGSETNGSTTGYTYGNDGSGNGAAQNAACGAGSTAPVWGDSGQQLGVMVLVGPPAQPAPPPSPAILFAPGWFPGSAAVTDDPGGIPFYGQPVPTDATPAIVIPPTPEPDPVTLYAPGWFPGADRVTAIPGGVPFTQLPPPQTATPAVVFPVPEVAGEPQWLPLPPNWFPGASQITTDPGSIPFYSLPQPFTPPPAPPPAPFLTQVKGAGTAKYLADQFGAPLVVRGDSIWGLVNQAGYRGGATSYQSDIDLYMSSRRAQGFNCALVDCITTTGEGLTNATLNGNTWDGVAPFTGGIGTLNPNYWTRVDYAVRSAASNGITVFLVLADKYPLNNAGGATNGMTTGQATTYGAALAARYASQPNIVWLFGNDYNDTNDAVYDAILAALRAGGDSHLVTVENLTEGDSRFSDLAATTYAWGTANAQINFVYTYAGAYPCLGYAYGEASPLAVLLGDGWYDGTGFGTIPSAPRDFMRGIVWWSLSSGSRGYIYGDESLISWNPPTALTTTPFTATDLNLIWNAYSSWTGWHQLVPDTGNVLVTGHRGTNLGLFAANTAGSYTGQAGDLGGAPNYYVTASITADHSLAVLYLPDATGTQNGGAVTIDQTQLGAGYTANWVDPATGAATPTTTGSSYSTVTSNSQGRSDWVLLLQGPPTGGAVSANAGLASGTGAAQQAAAAAGANAAAATGTGTSQPPVAALGANAAVATGTGAAQAPVAALGVNAGDPAGTGTAQPPVAAIGVNAGLATGTGTAQQPTVSTVPAVNAPAGAATGTGTAQAPLIAIAVNAGAATGTGTAQQPSVSTSGSVNANAGLATGTGAAQSAVTAIGVNAGAATGTGTAQAATGQVARTVTAGLATGTGAAQAPSLTLVLLAQASAATALGAALNATGNAVAPFTVGTLTSTVTPGGAGGTITTGSQRTGGPS